MQSPVVFLKGASQTTAPYHIQGRFQRASCDPSFISQGSQCLTSSLQNHNTGYLPYDFTIEGINSNALKTNNTGFAFLGDESFDNGRTQIATEVVPSPEQVSSITSCSDSDAYFDSGYVDGDQLFHDGSMRHASESSPQIYVPISQFVEGNLNLIKHGESSDAYIPRFPSFLFGNSEVPSSDLLIVQDSAGMHGATVRWPCKDMDISRTLCDGELISPTPCEGELKSQLKMGGSAQDELPSTMNNLQGSYFSLEQSHCFEQTFSSEIFSILFGPTGASKFVHINESVLHEDLLSYMNYKKLHVNGSQVSFVQYMHSTECNQLVCNCDRYLLVSHFENCHLWECDICEPVRRLCLTGKHPIESENEETGHFLACYDRVLPCAGHDSAEEGQPPAKRLKTTNSVSHDVGISYEVPFSVNQDSLLKQKQCLQQWPESPHCNNLDTAKYRMGWSTPIHDYTGKELVANNGPEITRGLDFRSSPVCSEELSTCAENENVLSRCFGGVENLVAGSIQLSNSSHVTLPSGELNICQNVVEGEVGVEAGNEMADGCQLSYSCQLSVHSGEPIVGQNDVGKVVGREAENKTKDNSQNSVACCVSSPSREPIVDQKDVQRKVGYRAKDKVTESFQFFDTCGTSLPSGEVVVDQKDLEGESRFKPGQVKLNVKSDSTLVEDGKKMKALEPKTTGVSLIDYFTVEEVKKHLSSLRQLVDQETGGKLLDYVGENTCQLCLMDKLFFAPAPVYCSNCGTRIKPRTYYHWAIDDMGTKHSFCTLCLRASRGGDIWFHGICISKQKFRKEMNNHVDDESWVQCDKCKGWQHQICALYNDKRDLGGKADYICPICFLEVMEVGHFKPLPRTGAFEAKDLPTTMLSDHIEKRLFRRLEKEREERAKAMQKKYEEVPGAADLVVRVVLSVRKVLNVKQQFLDIIPDVNYPTEFPFKSKVILLFQKTGGVDVCLFGFYVQEFGSDCGHPNQRSVYISYLDSVKYFRPEIKTASGEALRTLVYHEILIGYLDYCKKQGFATCYIWACPPVKGEDYILYCHPETQKTPKSEKLRYWYKSMLRKAAEDEIAVNCSNLHDHFFVSTGERNCKITAARLPYFDGDYWSVAAMDMINKIERASRVGSQTNVKKALSKRTLKSMGHTDLPGDVLKDILVMQKLGQSISPVKEDFIIVQLQFTCTSCQEIILLGSRWSCNHCKNFHLCSRCHSNEGNTHTSSSGKRHLLSQVAVSQVPVDTDDRDINLDNGYLEYRHSFLSFCQGNHFQFDTLRRAKHSSMMILYHLHNSTVQSAEATCRVCDQNMVVKQGWYCMTCQEFNVCDGCYRRQGSNCHVHQLSRHSSLTNRGSGNEQAQQHELLRLRGVMEGLLMHATQCTETKSNICPYPNCSQIRKLWRHAHQCNLRVAGGCQLCQKTWTLLRMHSENCRDTGCRVPRCMDLKKHAQMLASQSDARRSAAVLGSLRRG